jgi:hypothetical protein
MSFQITLTYTQPMSSEAHSTRDQYVNENPNKDIYQVYIHSSPYFNKELEKNVEQAEVKLMSLAKKAGLKPKMRNETKPETLYGLYGGDTGPLEMWFQIQAES